MSTAPESPNYADELAEEIADEAYARAAEPDRATSPDALVELPPDRFLDRQASWLQFNERLLDLASDAEIPLLERARFLAIFSTNLDDFFMVRVAGLKRRISGGITAPEGAGALRERLDRVLATAEELMERQHRLYRDAVLPELATQGIEILHWDDLKDFDKDILGEMFEHSILPVLTPLAVDPAHPFPYISGLSLNLAVVVRDRETQREHFARVKVPPLLPRLVRVEDHRFIALEEVIAAHLPVLFSGMEPVETYNFRVTRNEDVELEEEEDVEDLLTALERELVRRRFGPPVRLEVEEGISERVLSLLVRELRVTENEVFRFPRPLNLGALWQIADVDRPDLKYRSFSPKAHPRLAVRDGGDRPDLLAEVAARDLLVHHPYDSFASSVQAFVEQAAADPDVLAIKQTLYRTSGDSPIVEALIDAAGAGKQVLVLVEIKARFDEQANIRWARALEQAGCHVVYGLVGLKTHCKLSLVVRQEGDGLRRYAHIGTGNYNPKTARIYEDFGVLTADPSICDDVADLFNHLSGYTKHKDYENLLVAPDTLRSGITRLIEEQAARAQHGPALPDPHEGEQPRRRHDDRRAVRRLAGRRPHRPGRAGHVRAPAQRPGNVRDDPRAQHPRAVPRALADHALRPAG